MNRDRSAISTVSSTERRGFRRAECTHKAGSDTNWNGQEKHRSCWSNDFSAAVHVTETKIPHLKSDIKSAEDHLGDEVWCEFNHICYTAPGLPPSLLCSHVFLLPNMLRAKPPPSLTDLVLVTPFNHQTQKHLEHTILPKNFMAQLTELENELALLMA